MKHILSVAVLAGLPSLVAAHEYMAGDLMIDHPFIFESAPTAMAGGGYMAITNNGETADRLVAASADFPRVELHRSFEEDGVMRMAEQEGGIEIPAGETVTLEPGGLHVMFMGLNGDPFEIGEEIPVTLTFEEAGEVEVIFNVEARMGEGMDHSGHGGMDHSGHGN